MDIQHLIKEAGETMLADGKVMPMMQLELTSGIIFMALDVLSDSQSIPVQCGMLARIGWEECKKHPGEKPIAASFYAEAWITSKPDNDEQKMRPKLDPKRREVVMVEMWQEGIGAQSYRLPVIRDHKRRVVDIGAPEGPVNVISWQLLSFLQGVKDSQKPDEEVMDRMSTAIEKRVANMSPEKKQQLRDFMKKEGIPEDII